MNKIDVFDIFVDGFAHAWKQQLLQGMLFVLFGILVMMMPQLLVAMVAAFFMIIGALLIGMALSMRKFRKQYDGFRDELFTIF